MIKAGDLDYIETRLLAPCIDVSNAHARLRGYTTDPILAEQADKLMYAMQFFHRCLPRRKKSNSR